MASVQISHVGKSFGAFSVLHDINLQIADAEFLVLVGPSGCGKTTLLRMVAGLEDMTDGEIAIGGRVINDLAPKQRDIAMVFQNYALYPRKTVFENMAFNMRLRRVPKAEINRRIAETAEILALEPYLDRYPRQLSGGQRQRVAMGRAIVRDPKVFLFDEPLSNLDAKLRMQMRGELKRLHERLKTTSIYVTHDQIEAMTMADRIVVMHGGRIQQVGAPHEIYRNPANVFVAGFIGSPGMNLLDGVLRRYGQELAVELAGGKRIVVDAGLSGTDGQTVVLGIRPEDVSLAEAGQGMETVIELLEPTGADVHVTSTLNGQLFTSVFSDRGQFRKGQNVTFAFAPDGLHLFDKESGNSLR